MNGLRCEAYICPMNFTQAWIGMGSNLGDRLEHLRLAVRLMQSKKISVVRTSSVYETEPVGFLSEQLFLNAVVGVEWSGKPETLMEKLLEIEAETGRVRNTTEGYTSRPIDLDILLFGEEIINTSQLTIPHPRLHERNFVLFPLNELVPNYIHPVLNQRIDILKNSCVDQNTVFICDKSLSVNR